MSSRIRARRAYAPVASQHADWLTLVEPRGQFLTLPILRRAYPDGLPKADPDTARIVRERARALDPTDTAALTSWIEYLLSEVLGWGDRLASGPQVPDYLAFTVPERQVTLRPEYALLDKNGRARVIVERYDARTRLDARIPGETWAATPIDRTALLCRALGVEVGVVTNGRELVLVYAPSDKVGGHATWDSDLFAEGAEVTLLDAFVTVLGAGSFFARGADGTLEALLAQSASAQAELTSTLGLQVRRAVELLVASISRANLDSEGTLLHGVHPHRVYEASSTVIMRLVFMLYAEERGLLRLGEPLYDENYAASSLLEQLREASDIAGDEPLELRSSAWQRLLASFRALYGGVSHDRLRMPAFGGSLFDPDRFPFLEGRGDEEPWRSTPARPIRVDDLTVREILTALQIIETREAGVTEARRLSFRALDVEQIGHVYEGLLDHSAKRADGVIVGLVGKPGVEAEVALVDLESRAASGRSELVAYLTERTGRTAKAVAVLLDRGVSTDDGRLLRTACDNDDDTVARLLPFVSLLRDDLRGLPTVIPDGAVFVTETSHRRDTGTEYTTRDLADEIVRYTLEPLVYSPGPQDGADPADWVLKAPAELLQLTVCDPAVGSGAILVAACRYLADRLVESRISAGEVIDGYESDPSLARDEDELVVQARRDVADRCLFGVDRDPMAVEMAKLSLWLTTMSKDRPFTFVDHAIQAGDSLLGLSDVEQVVSFHLDAARGRQLSANLFEDLSSAIRPVVSNALDVRRELEARPVLDARDVEWKAEMNKSAAASLSEAWIIADLVVGSALAANGKYAAMEAGLQSVRPKVSAMLNARGSLRASIVEELRSCAAAWLDQGRPDGAPARRPMHWPLAFPEVFASGGFSAIVGNPPFLGGKRISGPNGTDYRNYLVEWIADSARGHADLVAYFFLVASRLAGSVGFLSTNTIAQGDTREVGLDRLLSAGWVVHRAVRSREWPGAASVSVAQVWMTRLAWTGERNLDGQAVPAITAQLGIPNRVDGLPFRLRENANVAFQGCIILGMGFFLTPDVAEGILEDPRYADVVRPVLNGEDLNVRPDSSASRWVIDFNDWSEERARTYPRAFDIVEQHVRPERQRLNPDGTYKLRKPLPQRWWQYADKRPALRAALRPLQECIAITLVSNTVMPVMVPSAQVFTHALGVIAKDDPAYLAIMSSQFHWHWTIRYASTLQTGIRYIISDVFETFPVPDATAGLQQLGADLRAMRGAIMASQELGLTKLYNRVHNDADTDADTDRLRDMHRRIDEAVRDAYGWDDVELNHGHHETSQGRRWTVDAIAQREILDRLLELNHTRHDSEVAAGHVTRVAGVRAKRANKAKDGVSDEEQLKLDVP